MESQLSGITPAAPMSFGGVALVLLATSDVRCFIPLGGRHESILR